VKASVGLHTGCDQLGVALIRMSGIVVISAGLNAPSMGLSSTRELD
jgi:hypothetical protein